MALLDAYATAAEYRARSNKTGTADDAEILAQLTAVSRWIESYCGRIFNQSSASVVRYFDGQGYSDLAIDDLTTLANVDVDDDDDGTYEIAVTLTNVHSLPSNAAERGEPYTSLELVRYPSNSQLSRFPRGRRSVKITGTWGWPAVPNAVKEATILLARELRDLQEAGPTLTLSSIDTAIRISPRAPRVISELLSPLVRGVGVAGI